MSQTKQPEMTMVCGSNGAGKSTLTYRMRETNGNKIPFIDPDRIAKEGNCSPIAAGRIVGEILKKCLLEKRSFVRESTLSSNFDLALIQKAKDNGYKINLVYVGINNVLNAIDRVSQRYKNGGHFVHEEDIKRRYARSLENLPKAIKQVDYAVILDNSTREYKDIATFEKGKLKSLQFVPTWFKEPLEKIQSQHPEKKLHRPRPEMER